MREREREREREIDKARVTNFPDESKAITKVIYSTPSLLHINKLNTPRGLCNNGSSDRTLCTSGGGY